jgi:putative Mg2+ transporter-C (MgtC) family protein
MEEDALRALIAEHGFSIANLSYGMHDAGRTFEYRMVIRSRDRANASRLVDSWRSMRHGVIEFRIDPA